MSEHVLDGLRQSSIDDPDAAFAVCCPSGVAGASHHGELIADRPIDDWAALTELPIVPYLVVDRHLRRVGKYCLVPFQARSIRPGDAGAGPGSGPQEPTRW